jgi:hypothetical protein
MNSKDSKFDELSRHLNQTVWCSECHLRIAPYDLRTVFNGHDYHRHCFKKMVHRAPELDPEPVMAQDED